MEADPPLLNLPFLEDIMLENDFQLHHVLEKVPFFSYTSQLRLIPPGFVGGGGVKNQKKVERVFKEGGTFCVCVGGSSKGNP